MRQTTGKKKIGLAVLLIALFATLFCLSVSATTYSGNCGASGSDVQWSLNTSTGELIISGTGGMKYYTYTSDIPWYSYRSYVKKVTIGDSVTSIGSYAFYGCSSLTQVTIGDSVTSIGGGRSKIARVSLRLPFPTV